MKIYVLAFRELSILTEDMYWNVNVCPTPEKVGGLATLWSDGECGDIKRDEKFKKNYTMIANEIRENGIYEYPPVELIAYATNTQDDPENKVNALNKKYYYIIGKLRTDLPLNENGNYTREEVFYTYKKNAVNDFYYKYLKLSEDEIDEIASKVDYTLRTSINGFCYKDYYIQKMDFHTTGDYSEEEFDEYCKMLSRKYK